MTERKKKHNSSCSRWTNSLDEKHNVTCKFYIAVQADAKYISCTMKAQPHQSDSSQLAETQVKHEFVVQKRLTSPLLTLSFAWFYVSVWFLKGNQPIRAVLSPPGLMKTMLISHKWWTDGKRASCHCFYSHVMNRFNNYLNSSSSEKTWKYLTLGNLSFPSKTWEWPTLKRAVTLKARFRFKSPPKQQSHFEPHPCEECQLISMFFVFRVPWRNVALVTGAAEWRLHYLLTSWELCNMCSRCGLIWRFPPCSTHVCAC